MTTSSMGLPMWMLLLGLFLFVMFTLGRKQRSVGLIFVGVLGALLCGSLLLTSFASRHNGVAGPRDAWNWEREQPQLRAPRHAVPKQEDQAVLIVEFDRDELDDEQVEPDEIARMAAIVCGVERRALDGSPAELSDVEAIALREDSPDVRGVSLRHVARVSRTTQGDPNSPRLIRVVRFKCPGRGGDELLKAVHEQLASAPDDANVLIRSHNRDLEILDLVLDSPAARVSVHRRGLVGDHIANDALENWERVFKELHGPQAGQSVRQESELRRKAQRQLRTAEAEMADRLRQTHEERGPVREVARDVHHAIDDVKESARDVARELHEAAREVVDEVHGAAKEVAEEVAGAADLPSESEPTPERPAAAEAPEIPISPTAPEAAPQIQVHVESSTASAVVTSGSDIAVAASVEQASDRSSDEVTDNVRPDWVDGPDEQKSETGVFLQRIKVGPLGSREECEQELGGLVEQAVRQYVGKLLGPRAADELTISSGFIMSRVLNTEPWLESNHIESLDPSFVKAELEGGTLVTLHALLVFDKDVQHDLKAAWRDHLVQDRLWGAGIASSGVLGLIATIFGYLRLDTATKGYYSGRLKVAAGAVILAVIAVVAATLQLVVSGSLKLGG